MDEKRGNNINTPLFIANSNNYGAMTKSPPNSPRLLIYCVHGKPREGCCKVSEAEIVDMEPPKNIEELSVHAKENVTTTDLVNRHCHNQQKATIDKKARRKLIIASILCVIFMIGEVIGGYLSGSLAIATDAAHLLTDFASFMISLFSLWVGSRPATKKMSFGWYRAEVIGALTSVLLIWVVTGILVYMAILRCINKDFEIDAFVMLVTSAIGVLVNLIMGCTLHQHGHGHGGHGHSHGGGSSHGHAHSHTGDNNINVRAAYIHVIGDFIQSFGVFVAALVIYFKPDYAIVDPICTFLFSVLVLFTTFNIIKDTLQVLMEGIPQGIDFNEVRSIFLTIPGVKRVHNLRIWALSLDKTALSAHLAIEPGTNPQAVLMQATKQIHDKHNFFEMTLQIEEFLDVMKDCYQCNFPE